MKKIDDYQIFFELRDKYPECCTIISEMMSYAFNHKDAIDEEYLYLGEYKDSHFFDENIKLIFKELGFDDILCITHHPRSCPHLMVKINS